MKLVLPILAMICTAIATLTALVFCMAGGANATPALSRALNFWMGGLTLLGLAAIVAGVMLIRAGQPGWAAVASLTPVVIIGMIVVVLLFE